MSWEDRLRPEIKLTSPNGDVFTANWKGNDITKNKKLGVFEYPNFNGTEVQDIGVNGPRYPLTFNFSGDDHDIEATRFFNSCDQSGVWQIIHPVEGQKYLYLVFVNKKVQPIESGGQTEFDTQWIEPAADTFRPSDTQIIAEMRQAILDAEVSAAAEYANNLKQTTAGEVIANKKTIIDIIKDVKNIFTDLVSQGTEIYNQFNAIIRSIESEITDIIDDAETLANQIQKLIELPALIETEVNAKIAAFKDFNVSTLTKINEILGNTSENKNQVNANEIFATSTINATAETSVNSEIETRPQALELIENLQTVFNNTVNALDSVQDNFTTTDIDKQFFSMSASYSGLLKVISLAIRYLIDSGLSLKIEKRFTLEKDRSPIEITVTEYGGLGVNDKLLDFFIDTNKLKGNDIRILPAGREVVIYA